ncbi:hypothetical protein F3Y22_tig00112225pilonHSYRG00073 [Hibiscus syriacus]|uniref:ELMO domain-containing protein n=1 Tax=Hibiscus syriacus TaxID=106335 RepID=A0A6A2Y2L3_HIBSY|nr:hypothetical protein F3Y22_tig00112225pilonHSYRG00073 [Hibiscus syriacus]
MSDLPWVTFATLSSASFTLMSRGNRLNRIASLYAQCACFLLSPIPSLTSNAMAGLQLWIGGVYLVPFDTYSGIKDFRRFNSKYRYLLMRLVLTIRNLLGCVWFTECKITNGNESHIPSSKHLLRELWHIAFPNVARKGLVSQQWKEMGWQGPNPSTDFRACGFISLENLLFYGRTYPDTGLTSIQLIVPVAPVSTVLRPEPLKSHLDILVYVSSNDGDVPNLMAIT